MPIIQHQFPTGAKVYADGNKDIKMTLTGVLARQGENGLYVTCEVSWFHNGAHQSTWLDEYRLELAEI